MASSLTRKQELAHIQSLIAKLPDRDVKTAIPQLREMGWKEIEISKLFGYKPDQFSRKFGKGGK